MSITAYNLPVPGKFLEFFLGHCENAHSMEKYNLSATRHLMLKQLI